MFEVSATNGGPSLNECLHTGPRLTSLIFGIFLRLRTFRTFYAFAIMSDIEKTFLQISVDLVDREYQRFLRFDDVFAEEPRIVRNRFSWVVFGVTSSPFSLHDTIRKHINYEFDGEFVRKVLDS